MKIVTTRAEMLAAAPAGCVLVPTMGALHAGHARLIGEARVRHDGADAGATRLPVVVSVFVNPTQFTDPADLARYPRTLEADAAVCEANGADVVFAPAVSEVYPPGEHVPTPSLPAVAREPGLEDAIRPGHFTGVCQVVSRLFALTRARTALFGEKDWQQLKVVEAMAREAGGPTIVGIPTVREHDGLAMSSRNVFLSPEHRRVAMSLSAALCEAAGREAVPDAERVMSEVLHGAGAVVEYAVVRRAGSLLPFGVNATRTSVGPGGARSLIAARVGTVRLIDNAPWPA